MWKCPGVFIFIPACRHHERTMLPARHPPVVVGVLQGAEVPHHVELLQEW